LGKVYIILLENRKRGNEKKLLFGIKNDRIFLIMALNRMQKNSNFPSLPLKRESIPPKAGLLPQE